MGVPVDQQNLAPVTDDTRRSLLREVARRHAGPVREPRQPWWRRQHLRTASKRAASTPSLASVPRLARVAARRKTRSR